MNKHILKLDIAAKPCGDKKYIFNCTGCPNGCEADNKTEALKLLNKAIGEECSQVFSQPQECDCSCHALGEHYPCHNPNCHSSQKPEKPVREEIDCLFDTEGIRTYASSNTFKSIIEKALSHQKAEWIEKIEGMRKRYVRLFPVGLTEGEKLDREQALKDREDEYNQALSDVLKILESNEL